MRGDTAASTSECSGMLGGRSCDVLWGFSVERCRGVWFWCLVLGDALTVGGRGADAVRHHLGREGRMQDGTVCRMAARSDVCNHAVWLLFV